MKWEEIPKIGDIYVVDSQIYGAFFNTYFSNKYKIKDERYEVVDITKCPHGMNDHCSKNYNCPGHISLRGCESKELIGPDCWLFGPGSLFILDVPDEDKELGVRNVIRNINKEEL